MFSEIVAHYAELKHSTRCSRFVYDENSLRHTQNSPFVRPSAADFVCDVELAAKSVLGPVELVLFANRYAHLDLRPITPERQQRIETMLGREFIQRAIWPLSRYFARKHISPWKETHRSVGSVPPTHRAASTDATRPRTTHLTTTRGNSDRIAPTTTDSCFSDYSRRQMES